MSGPLARLRIVEFAGIGPGPFAGMRATRRRTSSSRSRIEDGYYPTPSQLA